jgi:prepilin signal peptidase PulO-like enzyme (type II secretory pathway)
MFLSHKFIVLLPLTPDALQAPLIAVGFIIGACLGSFAQAAALRFNRGENIILSPSRCRSCGHRLGIIDNLPLIGWLKTLGFCRQCGVRFSVTYLLVEVAMGGLTAVFFYWFDVPLAFGLTAAMTLMMICMVTDTDKMLLHLPVMAVLGGLGFIISFFPFWPSSPLVALLGMVAGLSLLTVINGIYMLVRRTSGFGSGDFWLLGAIGLWLGPVLSVTVFFFAALLGALVGIGMIVSGKGSGQTALPFGFFLGLVFICWPIFNILVMVRW